MTKQAKHSIARPDCRYFIGEKPCKFKRVCNDCEFYAPKGKRILVIKLAAVGDVLRTTPLLTVLKEKYPESHVTWVTDKPAAELLRFSPPIDRLLSYSLGSVVQLMAEKPDILICLDKEPRASALASKIEAGAKFGFGWSPEGSLKPFNELADYAFRLGLDDDLKFRQNRKTYQEMVFEVCGFPYDPSYEYVMELPEGLLSRARAFLESLGVGKGEIVVGLNTGAGTFFATKKWTVEGFVELAKALRRELGIAPLILGGPLEVERNQTIAAECSGFALDAGCAHSLGDFAGIIACCDVLVTGDTLAMHLAISARKPVVVLMGPTCEAEIELYGRGCKLAADVACAPCYRPDCDKGHVCMKSISPEQVFDAVERML